MSLGIYVTLGDPTLAHSIALGEGAVEGGATLLEVGLPFSDPLLDGPEIQASHVRACAHYPSWSEQLQALNVLKNAGALVSVMAPSQLFYDASKRIQFPALDGCLITDLSWNLPSPVLLPSPRVWFLSHEVVLSERFTKPPEPISMVYLTRVTGVTGAGQPATADLATSIKRIKQVTDRPIWLGFGISSNADLREVLDAGAEGGIVGSAFIKAAKQEVFHGSQEARRWACQWVKTFLSSSLT